jgi:hypothetical protein
MQRFRRESGKVLGFENKLKFELKKHLKNVVLDKVKSLVQKVRRLRIRIMN